MTDKVPTPPLGVILLVLTLSHTVISFSNLSIPALTPFLREELGLTHAQLGMFISFFFSGVAAASIFFGWTSDLLGERRTLMIGLGIQGVFMIGFSLISSFILGGLLLVMAGIGYSSVAPATTKGVMRWFSSQGRATAMGVKQTGIPFGGILAAAVLPGIALSLGWRFCVILGALLTLSAVLLVRILIPPAVPSIRGPAQNFWKQLYAIFSNRNIMAISIMGIFLAGIQLSLITHLVLFLKSKFSFSSVMAGMYLAGAQAGGMAGRIGWGLVSDFIAGGKRKLILVILGVAAVIQLFLLSRIEADFSRGFLLLFIILLGSTTIGYHGVLFGLLGEVVEKEVVGLATGFSLTITFLGILLFPPLCGYLVDKLGSYNQAWDLLAFSWVAAILILLLFVQEKNQLAGAKS
jgi:ACS family hexuronate transporter-like MFS transporter